MGAFLLPSALFGPELGRLSLSLACCLALAQAVLPLWGARTRDPRLMATAPALAGAQLGCLLLAFGCLAVAAVGDDFSVANVAENSAVAKPLLYKITGIWGNLPQWHGALVGRAPTRFRRTAATTARDRARG